MYIYIYISFRIRSPEFCLKHLQPREALGRHEDIYIYIYIEWVAATWSIS